MVNNNLVGGWPTPLKNDGVRQWEGWQPIYEMENKSHVPNHQPGRKVEMWYYPLEKKTIKTHTTQQQKHEEVVV